MNNNIVFTSSQSGINSNHSRPESVVFNSLNVLNSECLAPPSIRNQENLDPETLNLITPQPNYKEESSIESAQRSLAEAFNKTYQYVKIVREDGEIIQLKNQSSHSEKRTSVKDLSDHTEEEKQGSQKEQTKLWNYDKTTDFSWIDWSSELAKDIKKNCPLSIQREFLKEKILLLKPFTDTIKIAFALGAYDPDDHPLEDLFDEQEVFHMLQFYDQSISRHSFEVKLDPETQELSATLSILEIVSSIEDFNFWVQRNFYTLRSVKELFLSLEDPSCCSSLRPLQRQLELSLESLTVSIPNRKLGPLELEALKDFIEIQRSLNALYIIFRADNTSTEQMKDFSKYLIEMKKLKKVKFEFIDCNLLEEDGLRVLVEELEKKDNLKSVEIFVRGCANVTRVLGFGEHIQMTVEPEFRE